MKILNFLKELVQIDLFRLVSVVLVFWRVSVVLVFWSVGMIYISSL